MKKFRNSITFSVGKILLRKMVLNVLKMKPKQEIESLSTPIKVLFSSFPYRLTHTVWLGISWGAYYCMTHIRWESIGEQRKVYFNALLEGHQKSELDETFGLIQHESYPIGNPRFPMKYILLDWTCEYDGHYDLEVEVNQIGNDDLTNDLTEVSFRLIFRGLTRSYYPSHSEYFFLM